MKLPDQAMVAQIPRVGLEYFLNSSHLTAGHANTEPAQGAIEVLLAQFTSALEIQALKDLLDGQSVVAWSLEPCGHGIDDLLNVAEILVSVERHGFAEVFESASAWIVDQHSLLLCFKNIHITFELTKFGLHVRVAKSSGATTLLLGNQFVQILLVFLLVPSLSLGSLSCVPQRVLHVAFCFDMCTKLLLLFVELSLQLRHFCILGLLVLGGLVHLLLQCDQLLLLLFDGILELGDALVKRPIISHLGGPFSH